MTDPLAPVFKALASDDRRLILDIVKNAPGITVGEVSSRFEVSRIAVMKHIRVLEAAHLLHSQKEGRSRRLYFNPVPIQLIHDRWTTEYSSLWSRRLTDLKYRVESREEGDG